MYNLWECISGHRLLGTNNPISGAVNSPGSVYYFSNQGNALPDVTKDLKFKINIAKWDIVSTQSKILDHEFLFINDATSSVGFIRDELVYQEKEENNGTISVSSNSTTITGSNTEFQTYYTGNIDKKEYVLITSGNDKALREVISVTSNTVLTIDRPTPFSNTDALYSRVPVAKFYDISEYRMQKTKRFLINLFDSNSNTTVNFEDGGAIYAERSGSYCLNPTVVTLPVSSFTPSIPLIAMDGSTYDMNMTTNFYLNQGSMEYSANYYSLSDINNDESYSIPAFYKVTAPSRSNEIRLLSAGGNVVTQNYQSNSFIFNFDSDITNPYSIVTQADTTAKFNTINYDINDDVTNENTREGNAFSKYITKTIALDRSVLAEDIKVYLSIYRPSGTDIYVYAKLWNNSDEEAFVDKDWSILSIRSNENRMSNKDNDLVEVEYSLPLTPRTQTVLNGYAETQASNSTIIGYDTTFESDLQVGDLIKIYPELFPTNYHITAVESIVSNTEITINDEINNIDVIGSGMKITKLRYKKQAFNNTENDNIVRYFNHQMIPFDGFNQYAIKIVFLSATRYLIPFVNDMRVVAVST